MEAPPKERIYIIWPPPAFAATSRFLASTLSCDAIESGVPLEANAVADASHSANRRLSSPISAWRRDTSSSESDHDHRQRSDHDNRCSISPWEYRSVPLLRMGNGTIFSDPQQRRCQPADVRPIWPACSSDSSTSPNRSFLTASESRSVVRVSARPRASSASTRSVRLSSFLS